MVDNTTTDLLIRKMVYEKEQPWLKSQGMTPEQIESEKNKIAQQTENLEIAQRNPEYAAYANKVRKEHNTLLKDPELLNNLIKEVQKKVVGETIAIKTVLLHACGIYVKNCNFSSYNLIINSNSGAGKSYITKKVVELFPPHMVEWRTQISEKAFVYWHNSKKEPDWTWDGKICFLEDVNNKIVNCDTFKVMISEGSKATIVIDYQAKDIEIKGKPVMLLTIADLNLNNELLRRLTTLELDETAAQTAAIIERQALSAKGNNLEDYNPEITSALMLLEKVSVIIPFADTLQNIFPKEHLAARTHFNRMLDLIRSCAALHQTQRRELGKGVIEADWQDYDLINDVMLATTTNTKLLTLSKKQKELINVCKEFSKEREWFSIKEIFKHYPTILSESKWYAYMAKLVEFGFFNVKTEKVDDNVRPTKFFNLVADLGFGLPPSELIKNGEYGENGKYGEFRGIWGKCEENSLKSNYPNSPNSPNSFDFIYSLDKILLPCHNCGLNPESGNYDFEGKPTCELCLQEKIEQGGIKENDHVFEKQNKKTTTTHETPRAKTD